MRLAANAGVFAATRGFNVPLILGTAALPFIVSWAAKQNFRIGKDADGNPAWVETIPEGSLEFRSTHAGATWVRSQQTACNQYMGYSNGLNGPYRILEIRASGNHCLYTYAEKGTSTSLGEYRHDLENRAVQGGKEEVVTEERFKGALADEPLPQELPSKTPWPWPVGDPVINPSPDATPVPQPLFVPEGLPQPVPNTDPQQYRQPGVRVVPAPTNAEPWRVDVQPVDRTGTDPKGNPEPVTEPATGDPSTKPSEKDSDLCVKNPDILACQKPKLNEIPVTPLEKKTVALAMNREEGFGPADASCPAARSFSVMGKTFEFQWTPMCDFAHGIRPLLIGFAYLSAVLAFMGLSRKDS